MSEPVSVNEIKELATLEFLAVCGDDDFPEELWRLLTIIRYVASRKDDLLTDAGRIDPVMVRRLALNIIQELLSAGKLRAWFTNYPLTDTYHLESAHDPVCQILQRIEAEWDALGREPSMCEIVAFSVPDREAANQALNPTGNKPAS
jgi:hypothetical protein